MHESDKTLRLALFDDQFIDTLSLLALIFTPRGGGGETKQKSFFFSDFSNDFPREIAIPQKSKDF